jgi:branched-chain amino acid transport system substrate-binding protein
MSRFVHRALLGAALLLAGFGHGAWAAETIKIGVLAPLSGNAAADGQEMVRGVQMAVDELNAAGGVSGYTFEVLVGDTKDQNSDAVTAAFERLAGDKQVHVMMTGYASGSNFEIQSMGENEMPYLISANSAQTRDIISKEPDAYPTVWSLTPSYDAYETGVLPMLQKFEKDGKVAFKTKKLALIGSDNPYSKTIYNGLKKSFTEGGWTITVDEMVPFGQVNDWRAILAKVRSDPPDVVINTDYLPANGATFLQQFLESPTNSLLFIQYAPSVPEFVKLTADKSTGVLYDLLAGPILSPKNARAKEIGDRFKTKWGVESGTYGISLYEQVMLYVDALKKVGKPDDHLAIGAALGQMDKQTAMGRIVFDPATHLAKQGDDYVPLQFYQLRNGERVMLSPQVYATGTFELPPWMVK